ncbi:MAG: SusC/RagA family TonB-linked outer membrane protein [Flavisolibacter sp.]
MKLTCAFMLLFCLHVSAAGHTQDRVTLNLESTDLKKVLTEIQKKTTYRFLYNQALVNHKKVDVHVFEAEVPSVLNTIFSGIGIGYQILENNLIVLKAAANGEKIEVNSIIVRGKVTGLNGEALAGVSVTVKGTTIGAATDAGGNYTLNVPDGSATLVFSYVGYDSHEEAINGRTVINVSLTGSKSSLDEIVVIGYGTASKRDLTGSIAKISGKEVADKPNTNPVSSLQGKVAGLSVVNSGTPGQAPDIRIRGTVSIGQVHPLYVVDGIFEDNIDYINPNDIESIEVLKDPSSLAIFGVRGATGVIAITTKKARVGQTVVNFNTNYGFKKLVDKIKLANADQFKTLFAQERALDATNPTTVPYDYSGLTANTDWIDAVTRTGKFSNSNLSVSGSTEKNRFNLGLGYTVDQGIIKHEELQRMLLSFGDEFKLSNAIKIGVNLNTSRQKNPYDATWVLDAARKVVPLVSADTKRFQIKNPYGLDTLTTDLYSGLDVGLQSAGVVNPLVQLENEWNTRSNYEYRSVGSIFAEISFLKNFTFRSTFYGDISTVNNRQYTPLYYAYNPKTNLPYLYSQTTKVQEDDQTYRKFQQDHLLNFKKNFGAHGLTLTGGFTTNYFGNFNRTGLTTQGQGVTALPIPNDPRFWYINNGIGVPANPSSPSSQNEYTTVSYLARALYNYQNRYFLNASFRDDASSRIPEKNRHQQFWAVGGAWELTRESFMQDQKFFNFLKLKGSIGVLGNQSAYDPNGNPLNYPFYPNLLTGNNAVFGTNVYTAADEQYFPNPDLKWETVNAKELGVELNAFQNRLHFEANYFTKTTHDLMTYVDRSALGLKPELTNGGSIKNWGEEFSGSWNQNVSKDFTITIGGNITFLKNKVLTLSPDLPNGFLTRAFQNNGSAESRTIPGFPIGSFYGYVVEGIYQSYADVLKSPNASAVGAYRPGDFKFKDVNGDGKITPDDRTIIGNPSPDFTYGGSINLAYKGLSLEVDVNGVYGNEIFRTWGSLESPFQRVNYSGDKLGAWHGEGTSNWVPILGQGDRYNYNGSSYNIEDGSYFRIRNIQLGYSFGRSMISAWKIKDLRIFANVQNLKTFKHNLGYTAEFGGDATAFGYDNAGGAIPVVTTFGLNITF